MMARRLAHVLGVAVDVFQKRHEFVAENIVIVLAPEPARVAKLGELESAGGADGLAEQAFLALGGMDYPALGGDLRAIVEVFAGALLTQVQLFELALAQDFGDVQRRRVRTLLALRHRSDSPSSSPSQLQRHSNSFATKRGQDLSISQIPHIFGACKVLSP